MRKTLLIAAATAALTAAAPSAAHAFCGFYVNGAGGEMFNDATQVVLMRGGTRTVLSMQNAYQGPVADFALVIPVPTVLQEADVKTLDKAVFAKVDGMGAPRLVEYWEMDPCAQEYDEEESGGTGTTMSLDEGKMGRSDAGAFGVTVEAQFVVGEYQIVILSATDSTGLDGWLRNESYKIPDGAEPLLRPYVEAGSKFFVAKVDPGKVKFENGRAALSPLRFHYDSEELALPIRLGLANSSGKQDLIVTVLSTDGRYEVSNYKNVTIPTNLDVRDEVRSRFGEFYAALFDRTVEKNPGAVVTEYSWTATSCDPCPGPQLDNNDLAILGADVMPVDDAMEEGRMGRRGGGGMTMTRLHARYGKSDVKDDLVFAKATPIVGGREFVIDHATGKLEEGAKPDQYTNNFQARYAIRHEWTGPLDCKAPVRHRWGGPPRGEPSPGIQTGRDLAFAPRGRAQLADFVTQDVPEIDVKAAGSGPAPVAVDDDKKKVPAPRQKPEPAKDKKKSGCGCATSGDASGGVLLLLLIAVALWRRRR